MSKLLIVMLAISAFANGYLLLQDSFDPAEIYYDDFEGVSQLSKGICYICDRLESAQRVSQAAYRNPAPRVSGLLGLPMKLPSEPYICNACWDFHFTTNGLLLNHQ